MHTESARAGKATAKMIRSDQLPGLAALSDPALVHMAKSGYSCAFTELTCRHRALVFAVIYRIVRHLEDTEDVLQESFLKAFAHIEGFDGRSKFSTWLTKIAINSALMLLRKRKCQPTHLTIEVATDNDAVWAEIRDHGMSPEEEVAESEAFCQLRLAVSKLPTNLRTAIELRSEKDLSVREIARTLEISEAAAKSRLLRARNRLEKTMRGSLGCPRPATSKHFPLQLSDPD